MLSPSRAKSMASENTRDDHALQNGAHDQGSGAHGQAALLLVESLLHTLIDKSVISVAEAIEVVATAVEVEEEMIEANGDPAQLRYSLTLLQNIILSLSRDLPEE